MSGKIPIEGRISVEEFDTLIQRFDWMDMSLGENYGSRFSKKFYIRKKKEYSVHHKEKAPYCTIFALGGIIIVGLKSKKEGHFIYDLVLKELKHVCPKRLK